MPFLVVGAQRGPAERPALHETREAALREARRLAETHPGDEFTVYVSLTTVRLRRYEEVNALPSGLEVDEIPF